MRLLYHEPNRQTRKCSVKRMVDVIESFKALAEEIGIPDQNRINLYLRECAHAGKKPALSWAS